MSALAGTRTKGVLAALECALEGGGLAVVVLDGAGDVEFATVLAVRWLTAYFGRSVRTGGGLPEAVTAWARRKERGSDDRRFSSADCLAENPDGRRLVFRRISTDRRGERAVLLLEEEPEQPSRDSLAAAGLTRRQTEVLRLVAQGLTNAEIATALVLSSRTVQKHLEHIYEKLGVNTRTAAAAHLLGRGPLGRSRG